MDDASGLGLGLGSRARRSESAIVRFVWRRWTDFETCSIWDVLVWRRKRAAWQALTRQVGEQLWLRHVVKPGEHQWARGANVLAGRGKQGTRTQVEHMRR